MKFSKIEYELTKTIIEIHSVMLAAKTWGCTAKTIVNRMKEYEVRNK